MTLALCPSESIGGILGIEGAHHSSDVTTDTAVSVRWTVTKLHVTISVRTTSQTVQSPACLA